MRLVCALIALAAILIIFVAKVKGNEKSKIIAYGISIIMSLVPLGISLWFFDVTGIIIYFLIAGVILYRLTFKENIL